MQLALGARDFISQIWETLPAQVWGRKLQDILHRGGRPHSY